LINPPRRRRMSTEKRKVSEAQALKAVMKSRGWCQGAYVDSTGAVCLVGAVQKLHDRKEGRLLYARMWEFLTALGEGEEGDHGSLEEWNDSRQGVEEVYGMLDGFEQWEKEKQLEKENEHREKAD
jgi:hypothetical protein